MNREEVLSIFKRTGALLTGHFQLTSGMHSDQYFQCAKVLQYPEYTELLCREIAVHFRENHVDAVLSPALGGIVVGQEVGRQLGVRTMFAERKEGVMQLRRGFEIRKGEKILVCEDVMTTGGSVDEVAAIVRSMGGRLSGVGCIVDRSACRGKLKTGNDEIRYSVLQMEVAAYRPEECPLCTKRIPMLKPGSRASM
jgi:orotate phosphoribosyltransferase